MQDTIPHQPASSEEVAHLRDQVLDLGEALAALTARDAENRQRAERLELAIELLQMQVSVLREDTDRDLTALGVVAAEALRRTRW
jgi:hypothetical protein